MHWIRSHRPHISTFLTGLLALCFLVILALPGELVSPMAGNFGGGYTAGYEHGWPFVWMRRTVFYDFSGPSQMLPDIPVAGVPWLALDSWKVWEASKRRLYVGPMLADAAVVLVAVGSVVGFLGWRRRQGRGLARFGLRTLFVGVTLLAAFGGWWAFWSNGAITEKRAIAACGDVVNTDTRSAYFGPLWLQRLVGVDNLGGTFNRVDAVYLKEVNRENLHGAVPQLEQFPRLAMLDIDVESRDRKAIPADEVPRYSELSRLDRLRNLTLSRHVGKRAVSEIGQLTQLEEITISGPAWDKNLPLMILRLQGALPNCRVSDQSTYRPPDHAWYWGGVGLSPEW